MNDTLTFLIVFALLLVLLGGLTTLRHRHRLRRRAR